MRILEELNVTTNSYQYFLYICDNACDILVDSYSLISLLMISVFKILVVAADLNNEFCKNYHYQFLGNPFPLGLGGLL